MSVIRDVRCHAETSRGFRHARGTKLAKGTKLGTPVLLRDAGGRGNVWGKYGNRVDPAAASVGFSALG